MTTLNLSGLEAGDTTEARGTVGTFSVGTTPIRTGQYALRCNPASSAAGALHFGTIAASGSINVGVARTAETFYTFYFRFEDLPSNTVQFASVESSTPADIVHLDCSSGGAITLTGTTTSSTVATISADTWYRADLRVTSNGTSGLKIDGSAEQTVTAQNLTQDRIYLGRRITTQAVAFDASYDDLLISNSGFPGAGQVNRLDPDGNGTYTAWNSGTGADTFADVDDDVPGHDSDTTYIAALDTDDNTARTFTLESSSSGGVAGTILSVKAYVIVRTDSITGTSAVGLRVRNGSTDSDTTGAEMTTTYQTRGKLLDTDPNGGGAWTSGGLDTLEVGVTAFAIVQIQRCTKVAAMVWCAGGAAAAGKGPPPFQRPWRRWNTRRIA